MKRTLLTIEVTSLLAATAFAGPIHDAARDGDLAGVQAELDKGADVNAKNDDGWTPLHSAVYTFSDNREIIELLISKVADVNARNKKGGTALSWAEAENHTGTADLLRKHGAKKGN